MAVIDTTCAPPPFWLLARLPRDEHPPQLLSFGAFKTSTVARSP
ncbi:hypothetical protein CLIM01_08765 [Colletotrichum limetticola]|uniref:Uncharacterized protein n=1 Tax=Colletotrichum limetticola TaxID=1209924 RepID=A0ABQ9PQU7_9PEZI|nr:hypothetical protein CLIM01_08765 [Colletotrichum limetticola]